MPMIDAARSTASQQYSKPGRLSGYVRRRVAVCALVAASVVASWLSPAAAHADDVGRRGTCAEQLALELSREFASAAFDVASLPGFDVPDEHLSGRAVDAWLENWTDPHQIDVGNRIVERAHALREKYAVSYTLWRLPGDGDPSARYANHVHIGLSRADGC